MPNRDFALRVSFNGYFGVNDLVLMSAAFRGHAPAHYAKVILSGAANGSTEPPILATWTEPNERHQKNARA